MEISREIRLPVSNETARKQLAAAFASTIVAQKGNWLLARIECTGRFEGETIQFQYTEHGKSRLHYRMTGHIIDDSSGLRLRMTVSDTSRSIVYYVPFLLWISYWVLTNISTGTVSLSLANLFTGSLITLLLSRLIKAILSMYLGYGANKIEEIIVKIVTDSSQKTGNRSGF